MIIRILAITLLLGGCTTSGYTAEEQKADCDARTGKSVGTIGMRMAWDQMRYGYTIPMEEYQRRQNPCMTQWQVTPGTGMIESVPAPKSVAKRKQ
jgi:hypothetical protein